MRGFPDILPVVFHPEFRLSILAGFLPEILPGFLGVSPGIASRGSSRIDGRFSPGISSTITFQIFSLGLLRSSSRDFHEVSFGIFFPEGFTQLLSESFFWILRGMQYEFVLRFLQEFLFVFL